MHLIHHILVHLVCYRNQVRESAMHNINIQFSFITTTTIGVVFITITLYKSKSLFYSREVYAIFGNHTCDSSFLTQRKRDYTRITLLPA